LRVWKDETRDWSHDWALSSACMQANGPVSAAQAQARRKRLAAARKVQREQQLRQQREARCTRQRRQAADDDAIAELLRCQRENEVDVQLDLALSQLRHVQAEQVAAGERSRAIGDGATGGATRALRCKHERVGRRISCMLHGAGGIATVVTCSGHRQRRPRRRTVRVQARAREARARASCMSRCVPN